MRKSCHYNRFGQELTGEDKPVLKQVREGSPARWAETTGASALGRRDRFRFAAAALIFSASLVAIAPQASAAAPSGPGAGSPVGSQDERTAAQFLPQATAVLPAPIVLAQASGVSEPRRGETIEERASRRFEPEGTRAGSFLIFPSVGLTARWDDNIFATNANEVDDFVTLINPELRAESDWNNHALNFSADAEVARFSDSGNEEYEDYSIGFDSRLDVRRSTNLTASASFSPQHEGRSSPDDSGGLEPTEFDLTSAQIGGSHRFNRLSVGLNGTGARFDFDDDRTAAGAVINNDDRDRSEYGALLRFGLDINPTTTAQLTGSYNRVDYNSAVDDNGFDRSSDGYAIEAGLVFDVSGVVFVNFLVGAFEQSFDDSTFSDVDGAAFRFGLDWDVTKLTTVTAAVSRGVDQTTLTSASSVLSTTAELGIDHELLRNLIIGADIISRDQDFRGIPRDDQTFEFNAGAQYLFHPRIVAEVGVNVTSRDSDVATQDFDRNRYFLRVVGRL